MAIKVVVNYPQTKEGMQLLKERQAEVVAKSLIRMLSHSELDEVMTRLRQSLLSIAN